MLNRNQELGEVVSDDVDVVDVSELHIGYVVRLVVVVTFPLEPVAHRVHFRPTVEDKRFPLFEVQTSDPLDEFDVFFALPAEDSHLDLAGSPERAYLVWVRRVCSDVAERRDSRFRVVRLHSFDAVFIEVLLFEEDELFGVGVADVEAVLDLAAFVWREVDDHGELIASLRTLLEDVLVVS